MKLIIDHPEWQTPKQRILLGSITLIFWMAWFYLWIPLISILAWFFGIKIFEYHMIELEGYKDLIALLGWYATAIILLGGSLIVWATYNIQRFKQSTRRNSRLEVSVEDQAKYFQVDAKDVRIWRESQMVVIGHNEILQISEVNLLSDSNPVSTTIPGDQQN